jgi:hypothetical protein
MSLTFRELAAIELMTHPSHCEQFLESGPLFPIMRTAEDAARDAQALAEACCAKFGHSGCTSHHQAMSDRCGRCRDVAVTTGCPRCGKRWEK